MQKELDNKYMCTVSEVAGKNVAEIEPELNWALESGLEEENQSEHISCVSPVCTLSHLILHSNLCWKLFSPFTKGKLKLKEVK